MADNQLPFLAMDGVLCDYSLPMSGGKATTKKEPQKMKTMSTSDAVTYAGLFVKNRAVANRFWAKCMGQDAAMAVDDETAARIKEFLSDKLSDKDHTALCAMLAGEEDVAEDNEPAPQFRRMPDGRIVEPRTAETRRPISSGDFPTRRE